MKVLDMKSIDECFFWKIEMAKIGTRRGRQSELKKPQTILKTTLKNLFY